MIVVSYVELYAVCCRALAESLVKVRGKRLMFLLMIRKLNYALVDLVAAGLYSKIARNNGKLLRIINKINFSGRMVLANEFVL